MRALPILILLLAGGLGSPLGAGVYSKGKDDPANAHDTPIPGYLGPAGAGKAPYGSANLSNYVNPVFKGWATRVVNYAPAADIPWEDTPGNWFNPDRALGPVTGDNFSIVSLNDLTAADLDAAPPKAPGQITLGFTEPIYNGPGPDFAVFENAFAGNVAATLVFAELAYVEVSSDGVNFARFPATYGNTGEYREEVPYNFQDPTNIHNLAGKHINGSGESWGTPFDLAQLAEHPLVTGGQVNLGAIRQVRLIDIPGSGDFLDATGNRIYDSWVTVGSGGADIEAIGVLNQLRTYEHWARQAFNLADTDPLPDPAGDEDGDGRTEAQEYAENTDPLLPDATPQPTELPLLQGIAGGEFVLQYWRAPLAEAAGLAQRVEACGSLGGAWLYGPAAETAHGLVDEPVPGAAPGPIGEVLWQARVPVNPDTPVYLRRNLEVGL